VKISEASRALAGLAAIALASLTIVLEAQPARTEEPAPTEQSSRFESAEPDYVWSFPRDHHAHRDYAIEWWYFTGHLEDVADPAARYAYQFTLFRIGLTPVAPPLDSEWRASGLLMGHAAITDQQTGEHLFSEVLYRETPLLAEFSEPGGARLAWSRAAVGSSGDWELRLVPSALDGARADASSAGPSSTDDASSADSSAGQLGALEVSAGEPGGEGFAFHMRDDRRGFAMRLATRPLKPRVFQGPNGFSRKSDAPGAASLYYSFTRLATEGELRLHGRDFRVQGQSWMDKEFSSSQLTDDQVGWDWFSLQLDDGREWMLFELRDSKGRVSHARGTEIDRDGSTRYLGGADWQLRVTGEWTSEASGITYPAGWRIELAELSTPLIVQPIVADQENRSELAASPKYWEGAVTVSDPDGRRLGVGFVELTGYGEGNRPPL